MNLYDIKEGLEDGSIVLDINGHSNIEYITKMILHKINWNIDSIETNGANWNRPDNEKPGNLLRINPKDEKLILYYMRQLEFEYGIMDYIWDIDAVECGNCGERLHVFIKDQHTLVLYGIEYLNASLKDFSKTIIKDCCMCATQPPTKVHINVNSPLYFCNHFGDFPECPTDNDESEYDRAFNLNTWIGVLNRTKYLAHQNIGYCQVGNTSIEIYLRKDKKKIIVAEWANSVIEDYEYKIQDPESTFVPTDEETRMYTEFNKKFEAYDLIGTISLGVWRWMCADFDTIKKHGLKIDNDIKYMSDEVVVCDAAHGKWEITNYEHSDIAKFDGYTVSEMELVK